MGRWLAGGAGAHLAAELVDADDVDRRDELGGRLVLDQLDVFAVAGGCAAARAARTKPSQTRNATERGGGQHPDGGPQLGEDRDEVAGQVVGMALADEHVG